MTERPAGQAMEQHGSGSREPSLRPSSWPGRPRRETVLRTGLVAVLLGLAFGVLHVLPADGSCVPGNGSAPAPGPPLDPTAEAPPPTRTVGADGPAVAPPDGPAVPPPDGAAGPPPDEPALPPRDKAAGPPPDGPAVPLPAGTVGLPVRVAEPAVLAIVAAGSRVDLLSVAVTGTAGSGEPVLLATRALVLDVVRPDATDGSAAVYLALQPDQAHRAVGMPADARFAIVVRSR